MKLMFQCLLTKTHTRRPLGITSARFRQHHSVWLPVSKGFLTHWIVIGFTRSFIVLWVVPKDGEADPSGRFGTQRVYSYCIRTVIYCTHTSAPRISALRVLYSTRNRRYIGVSERLLISFIRSRIRENDRREQQHDDVTFAPPQNPLQSSKWSLPIFMNAITSLPYCTLRAIKFCIH